MELERIKSPDSLGNVSYSEAPLWVLMTEKLIRNLPAGRYRMLNALGRRSSSRFLKRMPEKFGGLFFICDLRDIISREVCFTGVYEAQETILLQEILRPGMCFVDVGANWGYFTLIASNLIGRTGRIISLEPDPRAFDLLHQNILQNQLEQIVALPIAASNHLGTMHLSGYEETEGNFGVSRIIVSPSTPNRHFDVSVDTLDHILEEQKINVVDLMKMDIEGGEAFAIPGLNKSLQTQKIKRLLLELHPEQIGENGSSISTLIETLSSAGYTGFTIDHSTQATRQAAYGKIKTLKSSLQLYRPEERMDSWPHQLWLAPDITI